jgi:DNA-binding HxlR family transcriptional regulator
LQNKSPPAATARAGTDKWAILGLSVLADGPASFNTLKRVVGGISQKALTLTLPGLERHGIVSRTVLATSPVGIEYPWVDRSMDRSPRFADGRSNTFRKSKRPPQPMIRFFGEGSGDG